MRLIHLKSISNERSFTFVCETVANYFIYNYGWFIIQAFKRRSLSVLEEGVHESSYEPKRLFLYRRLLILYTCWDRLKPPLYLDASSLTYMQYNRDVWVTCVEQAWRTRRIWKCHRGLKKQKRNNCQLNNPRHIVCVISFRGKIVCTLILQYANIITVISCHEKAPGNNIMKT